MSKPALGKGLEVVEPDLDRHRLADLAGAQSVGEIIQVFDGFPVEFDEDIAAF